VVHVGDVYRAVSLIDDVLGRMERDDSVRSRQAAAGSAWHLLALLAADQTRAPVSGNGALQQAQQYLREHIGTRTSVAELAALARLSPSHFAALFRRATGVGVLQYQTRLRMSRARELLDTTDQAIAEIARTLGYADPFYFSRQFRAVHGVSASEYRTQHKG
jgi:AraC-like DNA-binding protein